MGFIFLFISSLGFEFYKSSYFWGFSFGLPLKFGMFFGCFEHKYDHKKYIHTKSIGNYVFIQNGGYLTIVYRMVM